MTHIRLATPDDALYVGQRLRQRDVDEVRAASGLTPEAALSASLAVSTSAWVVLDGTPVAVFGVAPIADGIGAPWLLATDAFRAQSRYLMRHSEEYLQRMLGEYPVLMNYVDVRNADSLRYLRRVGFVFTAYEPEFGVERRPFLQFMRTTHV